MTIEMHLNDPADVDKADESAKSRMPLDRLLPPVLEALATLIERLDRQATIESGGGAGIGEYVDGLSGEGELSDALLARSLLRICICLIPFARAQLTVDEPRVMGYITPLHQLCMRALDASRHCPSIVQSEALDLLTYCHKKLRSSKLFGRATIEALPTLLPIVRLGLRDLRWVGAVTAVPDDSLTDVRMQLVACDTLVSGSVHSEGKSGFADLWMQVRLLEIA